MIYVFFMFYSHMQLCMVSFNFPELPFFRVTIRENLYDNGKPIKFHYYYHRVSRILGTKQKEGFFYSMILWVTH